MADGTGPLDLRAGNGRDPAIPAGLPSHAPVAFGVPAFMVPKSLGEVKELARMIALAEWAPACYRDLDGNYLQPKIELAILHGATVGLGAIAAVHAIALIGGTPSIWGDGALSVIEHSGLLEDMVEDYEDDDDEGLVAICTMKRRDRATPIVTRFSMAMAERAGLTRSEGPWQTYPERMLRMRARSWTMRDAFADVLRGLQLREEVEDYVEPRGGRSLRTPHHEGSAPGSLRHHSSPRPQRPAAPVGAGRPDDRPTAASAPPPSGEGEGLSSAGPSSGEEAHILIDADGVLIEVVGRDALRAGFSEIFFDKHLSPDQIAGVWESNEAARQKIEEHFGPKALAEVQERLGSLQGKRPPSDGQLEPPTPAHNGAASNEDPAQDRHSAPDRALMLEINPTWGVQKIFQHYRAALNALSDDPARKPTIGGFREANIAVEQRLRAKLSSRIGEIDAVYQRAGLGSPDPARAASPRSSPKGRGPVMRAERLNTECDGEVVQGRGR